ncbi:MAG: RagB/SusD family nutrient uptake outer membrane protein [Butyricimonas faecihominis]
MEPGAHTSSPKRLYQTLEQIHMLLDNIHRFELPKETIHPYELQAHFYRALTYFHLAREFGSVPIIKNYKEYLAVPQSPLKDVLDEAEKSALIALELPKFEELTDGFGEPRNSKQYASKGAVAALLAQLYAWRAAVENKPEYWEEAEKYCNMIISGEAGNYALAENPQELCNTTLMGESSEGIWEILNTRASGEFSLSEGDQYPRGVLVSQWISPANRSVMPRPPTLVHLRSAKRMFDKDDRRRDAYFYALDADTLWVVYDKASGEMLQKYSVPGGMTCVLCVEPGDVVGRTDGSAIEPGRHPECEI